MQSGKTVTVKTELVGREEAFRILAVGHSTGLPVLLIGMPGTAKTNTLIDYASSVMNADIKSNDIFMLEVDEGTRSNEVKGNPDMKELIENKVFKRKSPITEAKLIIINEVDKASSGLRNSFLGIMNERILFDGETKTDCSHELFCASCNKIPQDEKDSPFWDRFVIKYHVERIPQSGLIKFLSEDTNITMDLYIPSAEEMNKVKFRDTAIEAFVKTTYGALTDRSILHIRRIAPAVKYVYGVSPERALIKATMLIGNKQLADSLAKAIEPAELRNIRNKIDTLTSLNNITDIRKDIDMIIQLTESAYKSNIVDRDIAKELEDELNSVLEKHPVYISSESYLEKSEF